MQKYSAVSLNEAKVCDVGQPQHLNYYYHVIYKLFQCLQYLEKLKKILLFISVSKSRSNYISDVLRRPLSRAFVASKNVDALLTVIQFTTSNTASEEEASENSKSSSENVSNLVLEVVKSLRGEKGAIVEQILKVCIWKVKSQNYITSIYAGSC